MSVGTRRHALAFPLRYHLGSEHGCGLAGCVPMSFESPLAAPAARYCDVRRLTEVLAEPLCAEHQTVQSMPDVSPTKWHRAHVTWFFEEFVLAPSVPDHQPVHPEYRYLFNLCG